MPGGKIDRRALPAPSHERPELEELFVPPESELERRLARLWCELLEIERVGVRDNFFDLGGHSLLAARLRARLETLTGCGLPLRMFFQFPTIRQLAGEISRAKSGRPPASLGALQSAGTRPPLFLVHGAGGGMVWGYGNLARHLGSDQPVYVFHARGLEGLEEEPTIETMAAAYVSELRAFQPAGPCRLGGYCFGGEVAFEMARQLQALGQEVELLALFNAVPPNSSFEQIRPTPGFVLRFLRNSWLWLAHFSRWTPEQRGSIALQQLEGAPLGPRNRNRRVHHLLEQRFKPARTKKFAAQRVHAGERGKAGSQGRGALGHALFEPLVGLLEGCLGPLAHVCDGLGDFPALVAVAQFRLRFHLGRGRAAQARGVTPQEH